MFYVLTSNLCSNLLVGTQGSLTALVLRDTAMLILLAFARDRALRGLVWCGLCGLACVWGESSSATVRREGRLEDRREEEDRW